MFKKILVPVDLSQLDAATKICTRARELVDLWSSEVHLVNVVPGYSMPLVASYFPQAAIDNLKKSVHQDLQKLAAEHFAQEPVISIGTGKRSAEIVRIASEWAADLIIIGCHRKESLGGEFLLGSCSVSVADRAKCSVLISR